MRQYLSSLLVVLLGVACGGTTDSGDQGSAGSPAGGSGNGTQGGSSTAGSAGKSSAGTSSGGAAGTATGSGGYAGTLIIVGNAGTSAGGSGVVDPLCPAHQPIGACSADDANVSCQYDPSTGCLCYPTAPGTYSICQRVDPTCSYQAPGSGGTGGTAAAGQSTGGISAKIALPPQQRCHCWAGAWVCMYGI